MKKILLPTILVLAVCLQIFGQDNVGCPNLWIKRTGEDFYVSSVSIFDKSKFEYKWTVSNEVVFNGQGTSAISIPISENMQGQEIIATVEIKGLPEGCKSSFSEFREVKNRHIIKQDVPENTFNGNTPLEDYLARIQNLTLALQGEKGSKGVIIFKFTKPSEQKKAIAMKKQLLKILKKRKVSLDGIEIKVEKGDIYETTVEFVPSPTN